MTTRVSGRKIHSMMKPLAIAVAIVSCVLAGTTVLSAQLGDVARKEAERRKEVKTAGKTYTNDTLTPAPQPSAAPVSSSSPSDGGATSTAGSASGSTSSSAADKAAADKATDKAATDKGATDKAATDKASTDKASTDKAGTDKAAADKAGTEKPAQQVSSDPAERRKEEAQWRDRIKGERDALERSRSFAEALQSRINALNTDFVNRDDPQQRAKVAADRDKAVADLATAKKEIDQHTKAITQIQDEARRAGAPAGWVR